MRTEFTVDLLAPVRLIGKVASVIAYPVVRFEDKVAQATAKMVLESPEYQEALARASAPKTRAKKTPAEKTSK